MASVIYVGQTMLISTSLNKKPVQATVVVVSKYIDKQKIFTKVLGMNGQEYDQVVSDQLSYLHFKKKSSNQIYHGIACTFKLACSSLPKAQLKTDHKKLVSHLQEAWSLLQKGQLVSDAYIKAEEVENQTVVE